MVLVEREKITQRSGFFIQEVLMVEHRTDIHTDINHSLPCCKPALVSILPL